MNKIPVLLLVFNRKDNALQMFEAVRKYQPEHLYIAADGPRLHKLGEEQSCHETRQALLNAIDWDCETKTLFQKNNLGCANAVFSAISWFFEQEKWGIIIEDDVIVSQDFFLMCEELLPRYEQDERIQQITSQYYGKHHNVSNSYTFQKKPYIWGWATWRRSWQNNMDMTMAKWPNFKIKNLIQFYGLFQSLMMFRSWNQTYKSLDASSSWATRWHFAALSNNLISICPTTNLAVNIGCSGNGGAHYQEGSIDPYAWLQMGSLSFPLRHPAKIELDKEQLKIDNKDFFRIKMIGAKQKVQRFLSRNK